MFGHFGKLYNSITNHAFGEVDVIGIPRNVDVRCAVEISLFSARPQFIPYFAVSTINSIDRPWYEVLLGNQSIESIVIDTLDLNLLKLVLQCWELRLHRKTLQASKFKETLSFP